MNPLLLVGADLFFSACFTLLALYVALRWIQPRTSEAKPAPKKNFAEKPLPVNKEKRVESIAPGEELEGDITQQAEYLREMGLSVEKIAGQLKVPTGEIEMMLTLSEMKKLGREAGPKKSFINRRNRQRPYKGGEMSGLPVTAGKEPQKTWLDEQPM